MIAVATGALIRCRCRPQRVSAAVSAAMPGCVKSSAAEQETFVKSLATATGSRLATGAGRRRRRID